MLKKIVIYNKNVTDVKLRANKFYNFYTVIDLKLAKNIETYSNWECAARKTIHCKWNKTHLFSLKTNKSFVYADINAVRNYFETLYNPLTRSFKRSRKIFPFDFKIAGVTPLLVMIKTQLPIGLFEFLFELFFILLYKKKQFGFQKGYFTEQAIF